MPIVSALERFFYNYLREHFLPLKKGTLFSLVLLMQNQQTDSGMNEPCEAIYHMAFPNMFSD